MRWNSAQTCSSSSTIKTRSGGPFIIVYLGGREMKLEGRAASRSGVDGDAPAVRAHDALADREPEPHAFFLLGCKERAEDVGQRRFGNADPGVGDGDHHGIRAVARGADRHLAAAGHRLGGVEQEIDQHLLELVGVRLDRRQPAGDIGFYPDLVVEQIVPGELYGVGDDRLDLARLGLGGARVGGGGLCVAGAGGAAGGRGGGGGGGGGGRLPPRRAGGGAGWALPPRG